ncbi:hypothetical protein C7C46_18575 [Streptomyces tateyamensis]|uniref:RDD domain-containing protein n=1 Tax=Streptomyces tateyamensis TaxID=565073 RepID=A0A2V4N485_9ACTN|nr:RDD family protein [Streptomyces tateyamensis]PYC77637.1 hypothetical protein C7C46_18575 [Streptomyces tateyamensis]
MSELVTGEAVVLGLRTAKLPSRALAQFLDLAAEFVVLFLVMLGLTAFLDNLDAAAAAALLIALTVLLLVGVPVGFETLSHGRSLGKLALGLRVVRLDGGPIRFRHALVRGLVGFFEIITFGGMPALITSLVNSDGRRLGDIFAGTVVVRERIPAGQAGGPMVAPPPQLMAMLGTELVRLDFSAVPEGLWLASRQLISRTGDLDQAVALRMAQQLAGDLSARVHWPIPAGLHPALYLSAVLTERQRREFARATAAGAFALPMARSPYAPPMPYAPQAAPFAGPPQPFVPQPGAPVRTLGYPQPAPPQQPQQPPAVQYQPVTPPPVMPSAPAAPATPPASPAPADEPGNGFALPG